MYTDPVDTDQGTFGFAVDNYTANESGGTATVTVNRIGGSDGAATVNWAVSDGTGTLADITGASSGSLAYADGELFKTFTVGINNDTTLERNETLNLTLSGTGLTFDQSTGTLTIRDNDFVPSSGNLILNEIFINSPGNDPPHEFVELRGLADMAMGSLYYVAIEGLLGPAIGAFEKIVDLGPYFNGSNGLSLLTPQEPGFAYNVNPATTQIQDLGTVANENVSSNNDSTTFLILWSPSRELPDFAYDFDWDNDGQLELPVGAQIVDAVGVKTLGQPDQVYGLTSSILSFTFAEVDAISRKRNDTDRNDGTAWFGGNLTSAGDDYLLYEASSVALPLTSGTSMTPGDVNTGTSVESPLVSLISVTPNSAGGTVTVNFNGPVSQVLAGDSGIVGPIGSGFSITDAVGQIIPTVDLRPVVTGIGTNSLSLSFTGSAVNNGFLPVGNYRLNVVGNGLVGNGRPVDAANTGTPVGSDHQVLFNVVAPQGDYNQNGVVDTADYVTWRKTDGTQPAYDLWRANFGNTSTITILPGTASGSSITSAAAVSEESTIAPLAVKSAEPVAEVARDKALVNWPSSAAVVKVASAKLSRSALGAVATSSAAERQLLLAVGKGQMRDRDRSEDAGGLDQSRREPRHVDDFFTKLGEKRLKVDRAVEKFASPA